MSLFKKSLLDSYNLITYRDDYLILHCSRNGNVYAPFDGIIKYDNNKCTLINGDIELHINHINGNIDGKVKAGDVIGQPIVGKEHAVIGYPIAYIGVKIYNKNELQDIVTYLNKMDKQVNEKIVTKEKEVIEETKEVQPMKKKSNNKKKKK